MSDEAPPKAAPFPEDESEKGKKNPFEAASLLSKLIFTWPYPLLKLGMQRPLAAKDLPPILNEDRSGVNKHMLLDEIWEAEKKRNPKKPSLHRAILRNFLTSLWYVQPLMSFTAAAKVVQAVALGLLVETFEEETDGGYIWAGVLAGCAVLILFEHHHVFLFTWHKGMQYRIAAVASIYDKALRLSSTSPDTSTSSGKILNLASNDVERFLMASLFVNYLFWAPVQSIGILVVGIILLGPAFASGVGLLVVVVVPLQTYLARRFAFYRSKIARITDRRVTLVSQAIHGARVMKMNGWEWQFLDRIQSIRKEEIAQIRKANTLKCWNEALFFSTNVVVSMVIFLVHLATGEDLTPRNVFTTFTLVNIIQIEMTKHVSLAVMACSECYVSIARIQEFLEYTEWKQQDVLQQDSSSSNGATKKTTTTQVSETTKAADNDTVIEMQNVTCYWNDRLLVGGDGKKDQTNPDSESESVSEHSQITALKDVTLSAGRGKLTCIIGSVGSGKSALLQAIVGELQSSHGSIRRNYKRLAYAAQDPWIMDGTVRENIVLGLEFKQDWYDRVVEACGLSLDMSQFRNGDGTILGDRGVQCSGGQRARIGLARALYRDADILVADDPLSAVDAKVGRHIFAEAINALGVHRGKCVILATHQHQYVHDHRCVLMTRGKTACIGSYHECVDASGGRLTAHARDSKSTKDEASKATPDKSDEDADSTPEGEAEKEQAIGKKEAKKGDQDGKEMNVSGLVRVATFRKYVSAMGGLWVGVFLFVVFTATQMAVLATGAFMGRWAERTPEDQRSWDILGLVIALCVAVMVLAVVRAFVSFRLTVLASRRLHDKMAKAVLRAKIEFYDTNPSGRILNRFSADVGSNDDLLPHTLYDFFMISFIVLGAIVTTITVLPFTLLALPPLIWYFFSVRKIFVTTTRELKRLEGLARSPIFSMLGEALNGIATIRANQSLTFFLEKFERAHNSHSKAFFAFIASSRWVGFRMDGLVVLFLSLAAFLSVLFQQQGWFKVDPAILGLALSMMLQLASIFQWCVRQSAEVINQFVSVERVLGFGDLEPEAELEHEGDNELQDWPRAGNMDVQDLSVRYRESLPLSLKNVSLHIPHGSRVGVCGRTGSGKSTLVQAMFRLLEAETGTIHLDGVNIADVGLHTLRARLSVIPQVPVLFSGQSVRDNLDPFRKHSDKEVEDSLRDVCMWDPVQELAGGCDSMVAEGGSNFSVGQRQLLCLARAILRKNPFLILDEPTANVDRRTDQLLQEALQKSFHEATILSVAHRLDTVIDYDYILVLGNAQVLEFGSPAELLDKGEEGHFASMVRDTGATMAQELRRRVRDAEEARITKASNTTSLVVSSY